MIPGNDQKLLQDNLDNESQAISDSDIEYSPITLQKKLLRKASKDKKPSASKWFKNVKKAKNNCFNFAFSKRLTQEEMLKENMEINVQYLLKTPLQTKIEKLLWKGNIQNHLYN